MMASVMIGRKLVVSDGGRLSPPNAGHRGPMVGPFGPLTSQRIIHNRRSDWRRPLEPIAAWPLGQCRREAQERRVPQWPALDTGSSVIDRADKLQIVLFCAEVVPTPGRISRAPNGGCR